MATSDPEEVDLRQYLKVLFRRRWWAIGIFLVVLTATAYITFNTTPVYRSTAEIMFRQNLSSEGLSSIVTELDLPFGGQNELANQIHIITGQATLERAHDILVGDSNSMSAANGTTEAITNPNNHPMTVGEIRGAIQVSRTSGTDIISISALSTSPLLAMKIVSAIVTAHQQLDYERTIAALVNIRGFLSGEIDTVQEALDAMEDELIRFQQESGLLLQEGLLINRVTSIEQLLVDAQVGLKDNHSRLDSISRFLEDVESDFLGDLSPEYEGLIQRQLEVALEIEVLRNRVTTLGTMRQEEINTLLSQSLSLSRKKRELDIAQTVYDILLDEYQKTRLAEAAQLGNIEVLNPAGLPSSPITPRNVMNLCVGGVLGLFGGALGAFLREFLDNTFHSREDVEQVLGVVFLGAIPRLVRGRRKKRFEQVAEELLPKLDPNSHGYQAFIRIATNFHFLSPDKPLKVIVVTSAFPNEGKSTIAANLALALAYSKKRILLVDADFHRPVLEKVFGLESSSAGGLSEFVFAAASQEEVVRCINLENAPQFWFLSSGKSVPNPTELISSVRFDEGLKELASSFDTIIVDSPPLSATVDASVLASKSDGTVLVIEAEKSKKEEVLRLKKDLERTTRVVGAILNKIRKSSTSYYHYYHHYLL